MNIAYIPARGGSKSIPYKNIKTIAGKPLIYWALKAACDCFEINKVFVSTDSDEIRKVVDGFGFDKAEVIDRSKESAADTAPTEAGMLEFAVDHPFDTIVLIQATSPLVTSEDIRKGFEIYSENSVDSVLSVVRQKRFIWDSDENGYAAPVNYVYFERPRRQDFDGQLIENGAFYITSRKALLSSKCRISGNIKIVEMPPESYIELDEPEDWHIVEELLRRRSSLTDMPAIKMFLVDCDGTLTDGGMYYSKDGEVLKKFNTRDAAGLRMLQERGVIVGIITGETSEIVRKRAEKMQVDELLMGVSDKKFAISKLCEKYGIDLINTAYMGDDQNDVKALNSVGVGFCVADGTAETKAASAYITQMCGGRGAVREAADIILSKGIK
ncbi:MAG: acylneuraminate cytidylyltransferase [Clostridiales bacterium]|nr:acylneuraminate cytidylyltransferase [Clostridiales bacterium]